MASSWDPPVITVGFYIGAWNINLAPHSCMAYTLLTETSPFNGVASVPLKARL